MHPDDRPDGRPHARPDDRADGRPDHRADGRPDGRELVAAALARIAPRVDVAAIDPDADLRDAADLDSMDFLNLVIGVHEATGIDLPERDYPHLATLGGFARYLDERAST
jgi:acyl carrier protein